MTATRPVVVHTMAVSVLLNEQRDPDTARRYRQLVADRSVLVSFVTVGEMRYGAIKAEMGGAQDTWPRAQVVVVQPDDELIRTSSTTIAMIVDATQSLWSNEWLGVPGPAHRHRLPPEPNPRVTPPVGPAA